MDQSAPSDVEFSWPSATVPHVHVSMGGRLSLLRRWRIVDAPRERFGSAGSRTQAGNNSAVSSRASSIRPGPPCTRTLGRDTQRPPQGRVEGVDPNEAQSRSLFHRTSPLSRRREDRQFRNRRRREDPLPVVWADDHASRVIVRALIQRRQLLGISEGAM